MSSPPFSGRAFSSYGFHRGSGRSRDGGDFRPRSNRGGGTSTRGAPGRGPFARWSPLGSGPRAEPVVASPPPPFGDCIETIRRVDLEEAPAAYCGITNAKVVASYNLMSSQTPEIMIPGQPPLWRPRKGPYQLREDDGIYYRDPDAAAHVHHPMEAAVVSVMKMSSPPGGVGDNSPVHLFACGSTLGNLLRFVRGIENEHLRGIDQPFRMLVEVVGNTVHLIRRENSPREQLIGVWGFGHTFVEENTVWETGLAGSTAHQRVIRYRFDGLNLLVRVKGDGYVGRDDAKHRASLEEGTRAGTSPEGQDPISLDAMESLKIQTGSQTTSSGEADIHIRDGGRTIPQDAILEIKTRSARFKDSRDTLAEEMPRLWLAQVKKFVVAHHVSGKFDDVEVQDVANHVQEWETDNQEHLRSFAWLLHRIIDSRLKAGPEVKVELVRREGSDTLEILGRLPDAGTPFSEKTLAKWSGWLSGGDDGIAGSGGGSKGRVGPTNDDDSADDSEDFTACDEECGYCGRCATSAD